MAAWGKKTPKFLDIWAQKLSKMKHIINETNNEAHNESYKNNDNNNETSNETYNNKKHGSSNNDIRILRYI